MGYSLLFLTLLQFLLQFGLFSCEKVLIIHPFFGGSHILALRRLAEALTEKGYEVKVIRWKDINTYPPLNNRKISEVILSVNNTDGMIPFVTHEGIGRFNIPVKLMWEKGLTLRMFHVESYRVVTAYCNELLSNEGLIEQLRKENFRVAIVDLLFNECSLALTNKLGIPTVGFWGFNLATGPSIYTPAFNPPSSTPQVLSFLSDTMAFMERVSNTVYFLGLYFLMEFELYITSNVVNQNIPGSPHPSTLIANLSGMLINSHPAVDYPRLLPPSFLEVAGMHLRENRPLPQNILDFIESSDEHGVILFSMGFNFDSKFIPRHIFENYFRAFGRLKQKVLVKAKGMPSYLPPNVQLYSFFPQADILAHNKTVLFISHCGMHGVIEAIEAEVPIVGIPVYLDQMDNLVRLKEHGVVKGLDKESTSDEIYEAITSVINDPRYNENMKILSKKVKSFGNPLEKASWLIEHIIDTDGAPHLKLSSRNLGILQYLCLDVLLFMLTLLFVALFVFHKIFTKIRFAFKDHNSKFLVTKLKLS